MNHNGVQSFPNDGATAYTAGMVVQLDPTGTSPSVKGAAITTATSTLSIGVVLQDVLGSDSGRPVDVQLFSAGGTALVEASGTIAIGTNVACQGDGTFDTGAVALGEPCGVALEAAITGGLFRVLITQ
jgi:hypothetical protein